MIAADITQGTLPTSAVFRREDYTLDEQRVIVAVDAIVKATFIEDWEAAPDEAEDTFLDRLTFLFDSKYSDLVRLVAERTQSSIW